MKYLTFVFVFLIASFLGAELWAIPPGFNIQGRLTDAAGVNKDGTFLIKFSIFSVDTGGTAVWEKTMSSVMVKNGNFQVILQGVGDVGGQLEDAVKDMDTAYVEIKVGSESPLVPRQTLLRSPFSSPSVVSSKVDVLIQSDNQSSGAGLIVMRTGSNDRVTVLNNGNVGVGTGSPTEKLQVNGRVKDKTGYLLPVGTVIAYAAATRPDGWLICDGASYSVTEFADLFEAIECSFGCPDPNTFKVPDLRGEFVRGYDTSGSVDPDRLFGSNQAEELKAHSHTDNTFQQISATWRGGGGNSPGDATGRSAPIATTGITGGAETRPRNVALLYIIKH